MSMYFDMHKNLPTALIIVIYQYTVNKSCHDLNYPLNIKLIESLCIHLQTFN